MSKEAALASRAEGSKLVLFAQFAESTEVATRAVVERCKQALEKVPDRNFKPAIIDNLEEAAAHWAIRRASFKLIKNYAEGNMRAVPVIEDTIVDVAKYGEFLARLQLILSDYNMKYTFAGHIGNGSIRLIPLVDFAASDAVDKVFDLARRTYELVIEFGGSISVDHNDGIIRTPFLNMMFKPEILAIFSQTKKIFDPHGIFNPGKKVPASNPPIGTLDYAKAHLSRVNKGLI
jgi:FAD/FMN-containing dehydrogenase